MTVLSGGREDCGGCRPRDLDDWGSLGGVRIAAAGKRKDRGDGGNQGDAGSDAQTHGHRVDEGAVRSGHQLAAWRATGLRPPWPVSLALTADLYAEPTARARAVGIWGGAGGVALAARPVLGGVLVQHSGWPGILWINVPAGLAAAIALGRLLPRARQQHARQRIDALGQVLFVIGAAGLTYSLIEGNTSGWGSAIIAGVFTLAVLARGGFAVWGGTLRAPDASGNAAAGPGGSSRVRGELPRPVRPVRRPVPAHHLLPAKSNASPRPGPGSGSSR